jgi:hypothetical protein
VFEVLAHQLMFDDLDQLRFGDRVKEVVKHLGLKLKCLFDRDQSLTDIMLLLQFDRLLLEVDVRLPQELWL